MGIPVDERDAVPGADPSLHPVETRRTPPGGVQSQPGRSPVAAPAVWRRHLLTVIYAGCARRCAAGEAGR